MAPSNGHLVSNRGYMEGLGMHHTPNKSMPYSSPILTLNPKPWTTYSDMFRHLPDLSDLALAASTTHPKPQPLSPQPTLNRKPYLDPLKVCRTIAFYRFWAIVLPTFGGLGKHYSRSPKVGNPIESILKSNV